MKKIIILVGILFFGSAGLVHADYTASSTPNLNTGLSTIAAGEYSTAASPLTSEGEGTISALMACLYTTGSPSGTVTAALQLDDGGEPDDVDIVSKTINISGIDGTQVRRTFTLAAPQDIDPTTDYWIVITRSATDNALRLCGTAGSGPTKGKIGGGWELMGQNMNVAMFVTSEGGEEEAPEGGGIASTTDQTVAVATLQGNTLRDGMMLFMIAFAIMIFYFKNV